MSVSRRPDIAQAIGHVQKYSAREPWLAHRRAHLERMLGRIPERYALELDALFEEIVELGHASTLHAFLEETFLASEFGPGNVNVIDDYLRRRGWQETPRAREYLQGMRSHAMSLHEVHDVAPGEWIELKDLYRGGPPRRIAEASASLGLQRWDRLVARIVIARGEEMLTGAALPLTRESAEVLEGILGRCRDKGRRAAEALARKHGVDLEVAGDVDETLLRIGDPVFLQVWLKGLLDLGRRPRPELANTDGEALLFSTTRLPVASADETELVRRLDALRGWERKPDDPPAWTWQPGGGTPQTIHASARLADGALVVETNSRERMERCLAALRTALGPLVGEALTSHEDPEHLLRDGAPRGASEASGEPLADPEIEAVLYRVKDAHYHRVLDEPVPMLGDKTPRACARTKAGRARLVRWLKEIENGELHQAATSGQAPYDIGWMWQELGVRPE